MDDDDEEDISEDAEHACTWPTRAVSETRCLIDCDDDTTTSTLSSSCLLPLLLGDGGDDINRSRKASWSTCPAETFSVWGEDDSGEEVTVSSSLLVGEVLGGEELDDGGEGSDSEPSRYDTACNTTNTYSLDSTPSDGELINMLLLLVVSR